VFVLVVAPPDEATAALVAAAGGLVVCAVATRGEALPLLASSELGAVLTTVTLPDGTGLGLLAWLREQRPEVGRFLWARYDELPELLRTGASTQSERVLARPGRAASVIRTLCERLELGDPFLDGDQTAQFGALSASVQRTATAFARVHGAVVRSLPANASAAQLQIVVPTGNDAEHVRRGVIDYFGAALKERGQTDDDAFRRHPLFGVLGALSVEQEVFAVRPTMEDVVYVAIFPWRKEAKTTVVIGVLSEGDALEGDRVVRGARERVVEELGEFAVPMLDSAPAGKARYVPDYDWVVTANYAGPDRRTKPTGFANSFLVFGQRTELAAGLEKVGGFVDRFRPWVLHAFAAYVLLSSIDTVLTWVVIGGGRARELNPLLRPLIGAHPWAFAVMKNALSLTSFLVVARFQLFRWGRLLVAVNLGLYAVLDCYWAVLIQSLLKRLP
jgi:hypothetical protein